VAEDLLQLLLDERACRLLVERYTYAVDWMNWQGLEQLFWPDALIDFGLWSGDRDAFIPWVTALESGYSRRLHLFGAPRLQINDASGQGEAGCFMYLRSGDTAESSRDEIMVARYLFRFAKRDGEWRFSELRCLLHGVQGFAASDHGGADFFADGLTPAHPLFAQ